MPAVSPPSSRLSAVVELLAADQLEPSVVLISDLDEPDVELAVRPASPAGVVADLHGLVVPDDVDAVAAITGATARLLDDPLVAWRTSLVVALGRDDAAASASDLDGEPPTLLDDGPLVDALRRALGLATPPPELTVDRLRDRLWGDRLLAAALNGERLDRRRARELRPRSIASWSHLRRACAGGGWRELGVAPQVAAWMDDGAFARWVLDELPSIDDVLDELCGVVDDDVLDLLAVLHWSEADECPEEPW